ncbi:hypothetical protein F5144DRAFT_570343, partial [Chaetomium tenue]
MTLCFRPLLLNVCESNILLLCAPVFNSSLVTGWYLVACDGSSFFKLCKTSPFCFAPWNLYVTICTLQREDGYLNTHEI